LCRVHFCYQSVALKLLAALHPADERRKHRTHAFILVPIDNVSKLCIRGYILYPENAGEVVALHLFLKAPLELKQGGILEVEHRKGTAIAGLNRVVDAPDTTVIADCTGVFSKALVEATKSKFARPTATTSSHDSGNSTK